MDSIKRQLEDRISFLHKEVDRLTREKENAESMHVRGLCAGQVISIDSEILELQSLLRFINTQKRAA